MDPLTVLTLACGVIQIVDFSAKILKKCQEIYDHGVFTEYQELDFLARHLTGLQTGLSIPEPSQIYGRPQAPGGEGIQELANQCSSTAVGYIPGIDIVNNQYSSLMFFH